MTPFLRVLARLTAARKPHRRWRDVGLGVVVGACLGAAGLVSTEWMAWAVLLYCTSMQTIAMVENDVFCDFRDFRRLGFREVSPAYRLAYVTHYVARDQFVALGIALALGSTLLVVGGRPWSGLLLPVAYVASVALIPSHVYLAFRIAERAKAWYLGGLYLAVMLLLVPLVLGFRVPEHLFGVLVAVWVGATVLHIVVVDRVAATLRGNGISTHGGRRWFVWLKRWSPHLYKDVLLFHATAAQSLLVGVALFVMLAGGSPPGTLGALVLLTLCHDNAFLVRKKKVWTIVGDDPLFSERALPADATTLRRSKLRTLALDVPLKLVAATVLLACTGELRGDHLAVIALVLLTNLVVSAPLPYRRRAPWVTKAPSPWGSRPAPRPISTSTRSS